MQTTHATHKRLQKPSIGLFCIEPNENLGIVYKLHFTRLNYSVHVVRSVSETTVAPEGTQVILVDIEVPNARAWLDRYFKQNNNARIVITSECGDILKVARMYDNVSALTKPFVFQELSELVDVLSHDDWSSQISSEPDR